MFDEKTRTSDHQQLDNELLPVESEEIGRIDAIEKDLEKQLQQELEKALSRDAAGVRDSRFSSSQATNASVHDETAPLSRDVSRKEADLEAARGVFNPGESYPDGGSKAWLTVMGTWFVLLVTLGFMNSIGVFQAYYKSELLSQYSSSTLSWINGVQLFLMFAGGSVAGPLFDIFGPKWILRGGGLGMVFGIMMLSISREYYQIFLSQGIVVALASAFTFYPCINAVATWFYHRRALAIGLATTGGSVGGVVFPILMSKCLPKLGFGWSLRLIGFIMLFLLCLAALLVRSRLNHPGTFKGRKLILFDYEAFKAPAWAYFSLGCFVQLLGLWAPINYFATYALAAKGFSPGMAFNLLAVLNAGSFFGRAIPGLIADKVGRITCFCVFSCLSGILIVAWWLNLTNRVSVFAFIALYGATSGAFLSMYPACVAQLSPIERIGLRLGTLNTVAGVSSLVSLPLHGALIHGDDYRSLIVFAGIMMIAGAFFIGVSRYYAGGKKFKVIV